MSESQARQVGSMLPCFIRSTAYETASAYSMLLVRLMQHLILLVVNFLINWYFI